MGPAEARPEWLAPSSAAEQPRQAPWDGRGGTELRPRLGPPISTTRDPCLPWSPRTQVLVCSNYHWLADPSHWMGGTLFEGANLPLLHNFVAGAVAARV